MKNIKLFPKITFTNFHKELPSSKGAFKSWFSFCRYWRGRIISITVKHYQLSFDFRKNCLMDMVSQKKDSRGKMTSLETNLHREWLMLKECFIRGFFYCRYADLNTLLKDIGFSEKNFSKLMENNCLDFLPNSMIIEIEDYLAEN